jgi:hypothetical protein
MFCLITAVDYGVFLLNRQKFPLILMLEEAIVGESDAD